MRVRCEVLADHAYQLCASNFDIEVGSMGSMQIPIAALIQHDPRELNTLEVKFTVLDRRRPVKVTVTTG